MKKRISPTLAVLLLLFAAQAVLSFGLPLVWLLQLRVHEVVGFAVLRIVESAGLLLLSATIGAAFAAVATGRFGRAVLLLLSATGAHLFGTLLGLIWQALFFRQAITASSLGLLLGSIVDSALLPLFVSFLLAYAVFLRKAPHDEPKSHRDTAASPVRAAILASSLLFAYRLLGYILTVAEFVKTSFGFLFIDTGEKIALLLDLIPVFGVSAAGYFLILWARKRMLAAYTAHDREG